MRNQGFTPYHATNWEVEYLEKKASTDFTKQGLVSRASDPDVVEPSVAADSKVLGIYIGDDISSSDDDYSSNTEIPVLVPTSDKAKMKGPVTTGTLTDEHEGDTFDLDDALGVDQSASSNNAVKLYRFMASDFGIWRINDPQT